MTGHRPTVWVPVAAQVELSRRGEDARTALVAGGDGWWTAPEELAGGTDYLLHLDGGPGRPDPRSGWQPHGVHDATRVYDPTGFRWTDGDWRGRSSLGAVIYELHVATFTGAGTFDAAIERLDHLVDLGVDMVELMPVAPFPGEHGWGYDGVSLYAVHDPYGGPAGLQRFVDAAHARDLAVCLDVVYNHLGPAGNYLAEFGPYFTDRHHTPWGWAVNLDGPDAGPVRDYLIGNALRWLRDFHIDALRLDAVHALIDDSPRHLLAELSDAVAELSEQVGRPLSLIAESDLNDARMVTPTADGGLGMTAQWDDDVHHALHARLTGERHGYYVSFGPTEVLRQAIDEVFVHAGSYSEFRGKVWGAPVPADVDARRFVVFAQNHDQVGNRAVGDRPSRVLDDGQLAVSAALVILGPFTPMLFMGEEWGARTPFQYFTDHDAELGEAIRRGRTAEFSSHGWTEIYGGDVEVPDPQSPATVEASRLDWSEPSRPRHARMLRFYRDLIGLRRAEPEVASGERSATRVDTDPAGRWLVLRRGSVAVVVNLDAATVEVDLGAPVGETLLGWSGDAVVNGSTVGLPGHDVLVVRC
ncbi:malto-oligosyltrehalose trehalohydrolase [Georgenia sunbinii]|uniref:malto-oligosyltrehalose trehalohydrolase n=1 Tax=Georgenia sunbinii TaxID=3117728 RepID=UPI002F266C5E